MTSIKIYLLPLLFLNFFTIQSSAQSGSYAVGKRVEKLSKEDSILVNNYFTERDFIEKNKQASQLNQKVRPYYFGDEIYNEEPFHKNKSNGRFWDSVAVEVVVDVIVNTIFFVTVFWQ